MRRTALTSFYYIWLFIGAMGLVASGLSGATSFAAAPSLGVTTSSEKAAGTQQINVNELKGLLKTLEDPVERERLITQLRILLEAQDQIVKPEPEPSVAPPAPETSAVTPLEKLSQWAEDLPGRVVNHVQSLPVLASQLKEHLARRENLKSLLKNGSIIIFALLMALLLRGYLLRRLGNFIKRTCPPEAPTWWAKVRCGAADMGVELLSVLVLFAVVAVISGLIGWNSRFSTLLMVLVAILSIYWMALSLVQKLVSPDDPAFRLVPCGDNTAQYIVIWARRLLLYGLFTYTPLWILGWAEWKGNVIEGLRMVYRFGWIALLGVLFFQLKDPLVSRIPTVREGKTTSTKFISTNINRLLPRVYPMLVLFLLVILSIGAVGYADKASFLLLRTGLSLLIITLGFGIWAIFGFLLEKLFAIGDRVKARFPGLDVMANRYISLLQLSIKSVLTIFVLVMVFQAWGLDLFAIITRGIGAKLLGRVLVIGITIGVAFFVIQVTQLLVARLLADKTDSQGQVISMGRRGKTFIPLLNSLIRYATYFIAGIIILEQVGINTGPILAGAGIVGLAVGFGAQTLVKDILTGCFIILEDSMSVGDVVIAKGTGGLVEAVNLRTIKLRDLAGNVHVIPNSSIEMITNMTKDYSRYVLDVGVAYREDVDEVIQVLKEIDEEMRKEPAFQSDILQPLEILGVEEFAASQVTIRTRITTKPIKQWSVAREMRRRIKKRFDELGIEIPFPHTTIYMGNPKREAPQPLVIQLQGDSAEAAGKGDHPEKDRPAS